MNNIETTGMVQLSKQLELIPQLRILVLGTIYIYIYI